MKIFLSGMESHLKDVLIPCYEQGLKIKYVLLSFYKMKEESLEINKKISKEILIDSGAFSFQTEFKKGKQTEIDFTDFTKKYAQWILEHDCDQIVGYFEMDVDVIIGYDEVLKLRKILESVSNKIIPVWHKNRGVDDYIKMCKEYSGKIVAISCVNNKDIKRAQLHLFYKIAKKYNCVLHALGMTSLNVLNEIPFDMVDSSSWLSGKYGRLTKFNDGKLMSFDMRNTYPSG